MADKNQNTNEVVETKVNEVNEVEEVRQPDFWDGVADFGRKATKWVVIIGGVIVLGGIGLAVAGACSKKKDETDDKEDTNFWDNIPSEPETTEESEETVA